MRIILDTNILVSALIVQATPPDRIYQSWLNGDFVLLTSRRQIEELKRTFGKPGIAKLIRKRDAGSMINHLQASAEFIEHLPKVRRSPDPDDDFLQAMAEGGQADFLVTGDKSGLLVLVRHGGARIIGARAFAERLP